MDKKPENPKIVALGCTCSECQDITKTVMQILVKQMKENSENVNKPKDNK
jgi:hypothetical protein